MEQQSWQRRRGVVLAIWLASVLVATLAVFAWAGSRDPSSNLLATLAQVNVGLMIALVVETRPREHGRADPWAVFAYGAISLNLLLSIGLLALVDFAHNWLYELVAGLAIGLTGVGAGMLLLLHRRRVEQQF